MGSKGEGGRKRRDKRNIDEGGRRRRVKSLREKSETRLGQEEMGRKTLKSENGGVPLHMMVVSCRKREEKGGRRKGKRGSLRGGGWEGWQRINKQRTWKCQLEEECVGRW